MEMVGPVHLLFRSGQHTWLGVLHTTNTSLWIGEAEVSWLPSLRLFDFTTITSAYNARGYHFFVWDVHYIEKGLAWFQAKMEMQIALL